jgi:hypothetical protein
MNSDKIVKWAFIAIVLCIALLTVGMFFTSEVQRKEASEKADKFTEKMRL